MQILVNILIFFVVVLGIALIGLVMAQTPKNEGFAGGVTDNSGGGFRGKAGFDDILSHYTKLVAIGWFVLAFVLAVLSELGGLNG